MGILAFQDQPPAHSSAAQIPARCPDMLCHRYTGVISRGDHNALDHSLHILGFSFLQKYLGATHRLSVSAGCYKVIHFQCTILQRIENQDQCHDLRNTCRTSSCIRIFFVNYSACTGLPLKEQKVRLHKRIISAAGSVVFLFFRGCSGIITCKIFCPFIQRYLLSIYNPTASSLSETGQQNKTCLLIAFPEA